MDVVKEAVVVALEISGTALETDIKDGKHVATSMISPVIDTRKGELEKRNHAANEEEEEEEKRAQT